MASCLTSALLGMSARRLRAFRTVLNPAVLTRASLCSSPSSVPPLPPTPPSTEPAPNHFIHIPAPLSGLSPDDDQQKPPDPCGDSGAGDAASNGTGTLIATDTPDSDIDGGGNGDSDEDSDNDPLFSGPEISADLTPERIVQELDRHIVGQLPAKKALAIALRNRWRRLRLTPEMRDEVLPKCCLLIGTSGVGKTELARRLSKLVDSPFLKTEATKYTEIGFHGRDVEQIIRDLLENAIHLARNRQRKLIAKKIKHIVEERILDELIGKSSSAGNNKQNREQFRALLNQGALDNQIIEVEQTTRKATPSLLQVDMNPERMTDVFDKLFTVRQSGSRKRRVKIADARTLIEEVESEKLLNDDNIIKEAIEATENAGIVVIGTFEWAKVSSLCMPRVTPKTNTAWRLR